MGYNYILFLFALLMISFVRAQNEEEIISNSGPVTCVYKRKDTNVELDIDENVFVTCDNRSCSVNGQGAVTSYGYVNITDAGTYVIEGLLNGQLYIEAEDDDFVHVILNDVTIFSRHGPAIYGARASKITITSVGKSSLVDTDNYSYEENENKPDACLYAECDLSLNGPGSLTVTGNYGEAIKGNKDIRLYGTTIIVPTAIKKGIKAKNSLCIKDVDLDVISIDTGIVATGDGNNFDDGNILIDNGRVRVISGNDGIHAESHITINNSFVDVRENITDAGSIKEADVETVNVETINSAEADNKEEEQEEEEDKEVTKKKSFSLIGYIEKLFGFGDNDDNDKEKERDDKQEETTEKEKEKDDKQEETVEKEKVKDDQDPETVEKEKVKDDQDPETVEKEKVKDDQDPETVEKEKVKDDQDPETVEKEKVKDDQDPEAQKQELEIDDSNMIKNGDKINEEEEDIGKAEEELNDNNNNNNNNNSNNNNKETQDQVINNTYQLPKYFHFDIRRDGEYSGNDEYKWRRE